MVEMMPERFPEGRQELPSTLGRHPTLQDPSSSSSNHNKRSHLNRPSINSCRLEYRCQPRPTATRPFMLTSYTTSRLQDCSLLGPPPQCPAVLINANIGTEVTSKTRAPDSFSGRPPDVPRTHWPYDHRCGSQPVSWSAGALHPARKRTNPAGATVSVAPPPLLLVLFLLSLLASTTQSLITVSSTSGTSSSRSLQWSTGTTAATTSSSSSPTLVQSSPSNSNVNRHFQNQQQQTDSKHHHQLFHPHYRGLQVADLMSAVGVLHHRTSPDVTLTPGPHSASPAALFVGAVPRQIKLDLAADNLTAGLDHEAVVLPQDPENGDSSGSTRWERMLWRSRSQLVRILRKVIFAEDRQLSQGGTPAQEPFELTVMASVKQRPGNSGTLLALTHSDPVSRVRTRLLEIQSAQEGKLRVMFRTGPLATGTWRGSWSGGSSSVETVPVFLADDSWHKLMVTFSADQMTVFLDCRQVFRRTIRPLDFGLSRAMIRPGNRISLWLGQQTRNKFVYKGCIQDFHLIYGANARSVQCPESESECPTCADFRSIQRAVADLQSTFMQEMAALQAQLLSAQDRIAQLETCDCNKSCRLPGGQVQQDGTSWTDGCQTCFCKAGQVSCQAPTCPALDCLDPDPPDPAAGICCPSCKMECRHLDRVHPHGHRFQPKRCVECHCSNGRLSCTRQDPDKDCPQLDCPLEDQVLQDGDCCKFCKQDYCAQGHSCSPLASCVNGMFNYTCQCPMGHQGDGFHCQDVDECSPSASLEPSGFGGHNCTQANTHCVNTDGSYFCECDQGYEPDEGGSPGAAGGPISAATMVCKPIDSCLQMVLQQGDLLHPHACHPNATCKVTGPGQHQCSCKEGFTGDGMACLPVCPQGCENGGQCAEPGQCRCPSGFTGESCQRDLDECALGPSVHKCGPKSTCVNKPGWHYCECQKGFRAYQDPDLAEGRTVCADEDECELGIHSCPTSTRCRNTEGSYECYCPEDDPAARPCASDCTTVGGQVRENGTTWSEGCNTCSCNMGKVDCSPRPCECAGDDLDLNCCPQCSLDPPDYGLGAEEATNVQPTLCRSSRSGMVLHRSGELWIEGCQECECVEGGEVQCWPLECPPLRCPPEEIARAEGQCCPTCSTESGLCSQTHPASIDTSIPSPCFHSGRIHADKDTWALGGGVSTPAAGGCPSYCTCQDGFVFCYTDPSCHSDLDDSSDSSNHNKSAAFNHSWIDPKESVHQALIAED